MKLFFNRIQKLNANAQPYYTLVGDNEELLSPPRAYDVDVQEFVEFLDAGKAKYEESLDNSEPAFLGQAGN